MTDGYSYKNIHPYEYLFQNICNLIFYLKKLVYILDNKKFEKHRLATGIQYA